MDAKNDFFSLSIDANQIAVLCVENQNQAVNTLSQSALQQLDQMIQIVEQQSDLQGFVCYSAKNDLIVGADIKEFLINFQQSDQQVIADLLSIHQLFGRIQSLPCPSVIAINGNCFGGGMEFALCFDYRIMHELATVGLPEVKLGIFPGFGGTIRLPRLIGADNAIEWICSGSNKKAAQALAEGAVDAIYADQDHLAAALTQLNHINEHNLDVAERRIQKQQPLKLNAIESMMCFETSKAYVKGKAGKHYPAPVMAIKVMQQHAQLQDDEAAIIEAQAFTKMAKTSVAQNLIQLFLNDQALKKRSKQHCAATSTIEQAAVVGAGIMGGGIAYQGASKQIHMHLLDIKPESLQLGLLEASQLFAKSVDRGKLSLSQMGERLNLIWPTLFYPNLAKSEVVIEAVVENQSVKETVLRDLEQHCSEHTVLCSNTSTISINQLAQSLQNPQRFCGMHFFNPVHKMPLVEVIRGQHSSDECINKVVQLACQMGKSVVVVNDCPGFLVNRVLFPYFAGFNSLLADGVAFEQVDKVMQRFGWPMGPAHLLDVVGLDTALHAQSVMAEAYPDRMQPAEVNYIQRLFDAGRLGQKNAMGFYAYRNNKKGKLEKHDDEQVVEILQLPQAKSSISDEDIIARMMIPLCLETLRALNENVVEDAAQADMAMIYGIGFPPFLGGPCRYMDQIGLSAFDELCDKFNHLGPLYQGSALLESYISQQRSIYGE